MFFVGHQHPVVGPSFRQSESVGGPWANRYSIVQDIERCVSSSFVMVVNTEFYVTDIGDAGMAEYQGKKVSLNKPFRTPGEKKKFAVYVKKDNGNVVKVRFGDPKMSIKKDQPGRKKSYCARSGGIKGKNDRTSANYWSRKMWNC